MKRGILLILCLGLIAAFTVGCGGGTAAGPDDNKVVVGATAKPHAEILEVAKPILEEKGIELEIKVFTDYVQLNPALNDEQIDANFFQHIPYLDDFNENNDANLEWVVKVHNEPMGVYSKNLAGLEDLPDNAKVGIPNDATNGGRALNVLEAAGLIKLEAGAGVTATDKDIVENTKNLDIIMMDAAMLPRSLEDLDICVINSNYALEADLNPVDDSIFMEPKDSPFANVLVVRPDDKDREAIKALADVLQSPEIKAFLEEEYEGSCVPAF
ncbi:MAG: MetQ/NlpA family ABC transporter substrate-binding protein [Clostridia bacterium]|nr:MetQ/NlpA family ABC transporter substrate-binding protein [Clostridia bacterium]